MGTLGPNSPRQIGDPFWKVGTPHVFVVTCTTRQKWNKQAANCQSPTLESNTSEQGRLA